MSYFFAVSPLSALSALEVHNLYKLRVDVFVHEQRCPYAEIDDIDALDSTAHMQAFDSNKVLRGTARVYAVDTATFARECGLESVPTDSAQVAEIGRVCVDLESRNTGLGKELMEQALRLAEETYPGLPIVITAQAHLGDFYSQFGFTRIGEDFDWDGIMHTPMLRAAA
ncbi:GNAT family N-acetyltransferase [Corynebacterium sp. 13CS0277]|uniref:GNAT family N-acetyltransferase n=1 Tax=Corynebacterium sp. 13CS0277 TaxID=2071994 RepID=UPI000D03006A|nr:GNAT family N-acetyltransferase [Corynebacterium sp. 13CS0277]PRQ11792.1 GNAT family N-acetyltransferase [Corynebacterium sp. 13CS0277]